MTQHDNLNVKLSNSQLNKLKSGVKNNTEVTLNILLNVIADFNDKNTFPHKLLLTNTQFQGIIKLLQIILQLI